MLTDSIVIPDWTSSQIILLLCTFKTMTFQVVSLAELLKIFNIILKNSFIRTTQEDSGIVIESSEKGG